MKINRLLLILVFAGFANCVYAQSFGSQRLHGYFRAEWSHYPVMGRVTADKSITISIGLPLRNKQDLRDLISGLYNSNSPNYRRFLTPTQFRDEFGPTASDYQAVMDFASSHGLSVVKTYTNRVLVDLAGPASAIEKTFYIQLNNHQRADGSVFFAPNREPSLDLTVPISHIGGLDSFVRLNRPGMDSVKKISTSSSKLFASNSGPNPNGGSYHGYYLGTDFKNAYIPCSSDTGSGQSLALVEFDGYYSGDISEYISTAESYTGLPTPSVTISPVTVGSFSGVPDSNPDGTYEYVSEVELDIEVAVAMAPGLSSLIVYEGDNASFAPDDVFEAIANPPAGVPLSNQISSSWSWSDNSSDSVIQDCFDQFACQGQSFFQASGDQGAYVSSDPTPVVPAPMNQTSNMTVVGGTELTTGSGATWSSETTWNNSSEKPSYTATPSTNSVSGGGICGGPYYTPVPIPTYQEPFVNDTNSASSLYRNIPDVSLVADTIAVYYSFLSSGPGFYGSGGTSAAAPLWASFAAIVNQEAAASGVGPVGLFNPYLYKLAATPTPYYSDFHDVSDSSSNNYWGTAPSQYEAVSNYDLSTGLGTIKCNLISDLVSGLPTHTNTPTLTPTNTFTWTPTPTPSCCPDGSTWAQLTPVATYTTRAFAGSAVFNGKMWLLGGTSYGDVWSSTNGKSWTETNSSAFPARGEFPAVAFDPGDGLGTRLWILGGKTPSNTYLNDVWSSFDGVSWTEASTTTVFSARSEHTALVYPDINDGNKMKMWVIGGGGSSGALADVWCSADGINWTQKTASATFGTRGGHTSMVFDPGDGLGSRMYVIGGLKNGLLANDVWSSFDGITWTEVTADAGFPVRIGHSSFSICGTMYVMAGSTIPIPDYPFPHFSSDLWSSTDGKNWTKVSVSGIDILAREGMSVINYQNTIFAMGGTNPAGNHNDVWKLKCSHARTWTPTPTNTPTPTASCCPDGSNWIQLTPSPTYTSRYGFGSVVFNNKMWILGGRAASDFDDTWSSADGVAWTHVSSSFPSCYGQASVTFDTGDGQGPRIWNLGGETPSGLSNQVWYSFDGNAWAQCPVNVVFPARYFGTTLVYPDINDGNKMKMWVIGGSNGSSALADVWCSADGVNWTEKTSSAAFGNRMAHSSVVFDPGDGSGPRMYFIAGLDNSVISNDVWSSFDGITWTEVTADAGFPVRDSHESFVLCGKIYVLGGVTTPIPHYPYPHYSNDMWSSSDGINWNQVRPTNAGFLARSGLGTLVYKNTAWAMGGNNPGGNYNDVWELSCDNLATYTPTPTDTPDGPDGMAYSSGLTLRSGGTATPTPSPSPTLTVTVSPTPTVIPEDEVSVVAEPNLSTSDQPIRFEVELGQAAEIHLILYTLAGEKVYETQSQGTAGINDLDWPLRNTANSEVASGLYLYVMEVTNRNMNFMKRGKVVVLH